MSLLRYEPTPLQEFDVRGVRVRVKREDLNHPAVSGNKWWKLKYNLEAAKKVDTLLTFGGAYSNHIYATAAAARELGKKSIGIIRGERIEPLNSTLRFAEEQGMRLEFISREAYREKSTPSFLAELQDRFGSFYLIPEGGTNELAVKGCCEFGQQLSKEVSFDYLCLPVGTAGTMAGLARGIPREVIGFSVLKNGGFLQMAFNELSEGASNGRVEIDYDFGGYAKTPAVLQKFVDEFEKEYAIPLDPIYTGKAMFGLMDLIHKGRFAKGSTVLFLHTGGLQGRNI